MTEVKVVKTTVPLADLLAPLGVFFNTLMLAGHADVSQPGRVPIDTGYLRNSLSPGGGTTMVDPNSPPMWAAVGSNVGYGMALEDPQTREPHYLRGPSEGQPTQGWLSSTLPNIEGAIDGALSELGAGIQKVFEGAQ